MRLPTPAEVGDIPRRLYEDMKRRPLTELRAMLAQAEKNAAAAETVARAWATNTMRMELIRDMLETELAERTVDNVVWLPPKEGEDDDGSS